MSVSEAAEHSRSAQSGAEQCLARLIQEAIATHRRRDLAPRQTRWALRLATLAVALVATILLGLEIEAPRFAPLARNLALVATAAVALLCGVASYWDGADADEARSARLDELDALAGELAFLRALSGPLDQAQLERIFTRYQRITCGERQRSSG